MFGDSVLFNEADGISYISVTLISTSLETNLTFSIDADDDTAEEGIGWSVLICIHYV